MGELSDKALLVLLGITLCLALVIYAIGLKVFRRMSPYFADEL